MIYLYLLVLLSHFFNSFVYSHSLIDQSNCIIGQHNGSLPTIITVKTIEAKCYAKCQQTCSRKFRIGSTESSDKNNLQSQISRNNIIDVNRDRIGDCLKNCYDGTIIDSKMRIPIFIDSNNNVQNDDGESPQPWMCDIYPAESVKDASQLSCSFTDSKDSNYGSICSASIINSSYVDGGVSLSPHTEVLVSLVNTNTEDNSVSDDFNNMKSNEVYLCGMKTAYFSPRYWLSPTKNDTEQKNIFNEGSATQQVFDSHSDSLIKTGIFIKDGDYLLIKYMGKYYSKCDPEKGNCTFNKNDYKLNISAGEQMINFEVPDRNYLDAPTQTTLEHCSKCEGIECNQCTYKDDPVSYNGLKVMVTRATTPMLLTKQFDNYFNSDKRLNLEEPFRITTLAGIIQNLTSTRQELEIAYPINEPNNSSGSYMVEVQWRSCNYKDGQRLEYTVFNSALMQSDDIDIYLQRYAQWNDVLFQRDVNKRNASIPIRPEQLQIPIAIPQVLDFNKDTAVQSILPKDSKDFKGNIYFRIKTLSEDEAKALDVKDFARSDTIGQYHLKVAAAGGRLTISYFVRGFEKTLEAIPLKILEAFAKSAKFLMLIKLVLIFYIAFTGLMFMAGMAKFNQTEGIVRILKVAFVMTLLSDSSVDFFNKYLLQAFSFDIMNQLANIFTPDIAVNSPGMQDTSSSCFDDPNIKVKLLCVMEQDLKMFFSGAFWQRIFGMMFSGMFVIAIVIIIGLIYYFTVIVKVICLYCIAMLSITITLSLAPLFIPLILFKYTKSFFDAWIKQLISFLVQPIFLFAAISLFRLIFLTIVQSFNGIGACKICLIWDICWFVPLSIASSSTNFSFAMGNLNSLIAIYFVGYGMYTFCDFATEMAKRLIGFGGVGISATHAGLGVMKNELKYIGGGVAGVASVPFKVLAIDDKSRAERKANRDTIRSKK